MTFPRVPAQPPAGPDWSRLQFGLQLRPDRGLVRLGPPTSVEVPNEGLTCAYGVPPVLRQTWADVGGNAARGLVMRRSSSARAVIPFGVSGWWPVTVARTDGSAVEHVAALPWWPVVGLIGHEHTFPAVTAQLADPLDNAALP